MVTCKILQIKHENKNAPLFRTIPGYSKILRVFERSYGHDVENIDK